MSFSELGNLMCFPFDSITSSELTDAHDYLITSTADLLIQGGRNWLPLIVTETGADQYQVIGNEFVYAVAEEADLEEVWCIVADDSSETKAIVQALCRESIPKINLSVASRDEIKLALDYLIKQPNTPLKGVNLGIAVTRIEDAPRQYWSSFQPITKLGCRITAGKKLKALEQVFYLTPEPLPDVITDRKLLESFTKKQLTDIAKKRGIKGISKLSKPRLVERLMEED
ncbi:transcription termination factor rho family protein [Leptolyngbya cf. ectocarpi LEGE 11479]|uniref:Transcription termination factor rho family protein n=1 Tax=Leptolyngbya cf. ectocarpi LEGE 11479 TaxID=1828722 RepID=A0A928ZY58_LEPEC|nr:Rho termination factor N-terminal domain-containing protein [Leptolyngbya ectocarpi]MBE9069662.1 transcription termination factor rho family protein [Leptolyngbya cf. ectocarpi LEGE 11479]